MLPASTYGATKNYTVPSSNTTAAASGRLRNNRLPFLKSFEIPSFIQLEVLSSNHLQVPPGHSALELRSSPLFPTYWRRPLESSPPPPSRCQHQEIREIPNDVHNEHKLQQDVQDTSRPHFVSPFDVEHDISPVIHRPYVAAHPCCYEEVVGSDPELSTVALGSIKEAISVTPFSLSLNDACCRRKTGTPPLPGHNAWPAPFQPVEECAIPLLSMELEMFVPPLAQPASDDARTVDYRELSSMSGMGDFFAGRTFQDNTGNALMVVPSPKDLVPDDVLQCALCHEGVPCPRDLK